MPTFTGLAPWIAPPIVGAAVGYLVNSLAVRIVVRGGATEGKSASRKGTSPELAETIAGLVSTELLNEEGLRHQIKSPQFEESLHSAIGSLTSSLLDTTIDKAASVLTGSGGADIFPSLLATDLPPRIIRELAIVVFDRLGSLRVEEAFGAGTRIGRLLDRLGDGLASEKALGLLLEQVEKTIDTAIRSDRRISTLVTEDDLNTLAAGIDQFFPLVVDFFVGWLRSEPTKQELSIRGRLLVREVIGRLRGIQRLIVSAAQFEKTLDSNMGGIVNDALDTIEDASRDDDIRSRLVGAIRVEMESLRSKTLSEATEGRGDGIKQFARLLAERFVRLLSRADVRKGVLRGIAEDSTLGELVDRLFDFGGKSRSVFLADLVVDEPLSGAGLRAFASGAGKRLLELFGGMRIREVTALNDESKERLDRELTKRIIAAADSRIPQILATVDFHGLVLSKLQDISARDLGKLFAGSSELRLGLVGALGALLGFFVGCTGDLLRFFLN